MMSASVETAAGLDPARARSIGSPYPRSLAGAWTLGATLLRGDGRRAGRARRLGRNRGVQWCLVGQPLLEVLDVALQRAQARLQPHEVGQQPRPEHRKTGEQVLEFQF